MSAEPQLTGAETRLRQYRTLLEIADAITAHRDLASLLQDLADRLRRVVEFDGVNVVLYDETRHVMRLHALSSAVLPQANLIPELPIEDAPAGWVWQTQQPLLMADLRDYEARYPRIVAEMRTYGFQTAYVLPLTSAGRRLGALGFGSRQAAAYEETTREFLQQVAKLVAVALDNALNFESAEQTRQRLARERDRLKLLLDVNNAVVAHLDLEELLHAVSASLQEVVAHDMSGIALYDAETDRLIAHALGSSDQASVPFFARGVPIPFEGTIGGESFTTGQAVFVNKPDFVRFHSNYSRQIYAAGIRSGGSIPLVAHGRKLGVLGVASRRRDAYSPDNIDLLCQVAHQIAIAVENSLHYESARTAQQHLKRERDHTQLLLEINNAVVTSLDLRELLETISPCLRQVIHHNFAAVLLYEEESRQLRVHALDFPERVKMQGVTFSMEGTPSGIAFTERRPFLVTPRELERFSATPLVQMLRADGVQSGCSLPLLSHDRALGVLTLMSQRADGFTEADVPLLTQIAGQVAIAVENALNYERARKAEQEAKRQADRLSLVLRINNAVVSQLNLQELLRVVSGSLREVLQHDTTGVALYDAESNQLRLVMTDFPEQMELVEESYLVPLEGTVMGLAFTSGAPVFLDEFDLERFHSDFTKRSYEAGLRSCGNIPLIAHGRKLGALGVASKRSRAFSAADIELLCQSANQIAIAVENALNFERTRAAEEQAKRQSERVQLILEINNTVVSQLSLRELVRVTSARLREALQHDVTGISLYDPETNQFRAYMFDLPEGLPAIEEGTPMALEGSVGGLAFMSGRPVFMSRPDPTVSVSEFDRRLYEAGIRSGGIVPLIAHDRKLGFLGVGSFREDAFSQADQELLCHIANQIAIAVDNALAFREIETLKNKLASEKLYLEDEIRTQHNFDELIGESQTFRRILKQVETVAPTDSTVLICGETGTGKELIARAIHNLSARRERTLVKINCAAIPTGLLESELFGHEKGAFTGAIAQRIGRFELAHRGTLFLDEVGDIPLELQPKLLRVLQEQEFERLGSTRTQRVDARLIAATNCDLERMVADRKYRSDLYYRLNVFPVTLPPLRQRREDIPALTRFFTQRYARRLKKQITAIPAETMAALTSYHWPGNVRELEHFVERAVILTRGADLEISLAELKSAEPVSTTEMSTLEQAEREHILRALEETNWVIGGPNGAAARLGLKRTTLQSRIQKLGIAR